MKKRVFSLLLTLVMVVGLLPVTASADGAIDGYALWVGGTQVTSTNAADVFSDGTVSYDNDAKKLTLNGANLAGATGTRNIYYPPEGYHYEANYGIYSGIADLTINLVGANIVKGGADGTIVSGDVSAYLSYGICAVRDLTITGEGTLNVSGKSSTDELRIYKSAGIYAYESNVTIEGGTVNATGGATQSFHNGVYHYNSESYGVDFERSGDFKVTGGTLNATGGTCAATGNTDALSYGIDGNDCSGSTIISGGTVTATGGAVSAAGEGRVGNSYGASNRINISGDADVTATGDSRALECLPVSVGSGLAITASINKDGSSPTTYNAANLETYKYLHIAPPTHTHAVSVDCSTSAGTQVTFNKWDTATSLPTTPGDYYLACDVSVTTDTHGWEPPAGTVNLCLNNHTISWDKTHSNAFIFMNKTTTLNVCDCCGDTAAASHSVADPTSENSGAVTITGGLITRSNTNGDVVDIRSSGAAFHLYGGTIAGGKNGIYLMAGTLGIHGGAIAYNNSGYGVHATDGSDSRTITMDGGSIHHNNSGGVRFTDGTFNMSGGTINDNNYDGVYVGETGTFTMSDGAIRNNTTTNGGVYVASNSSKGGTFNMSGGTIEGNTNAGVGGVNIRDDKATFNMTGGTIQNNTATNANAYAVGGVYVAGTMKVSGTAKITGNKCGTDSSAVDSNVKLPSGKTITVSTPLTIGAAIGVSTMTSPTEGSPVAVTGANDANYSGYFASDNSSYQIYNDSNTVKLRVPPPTTYTVTFAGGDGATGTAPTQADTVAGGTFTLPDNPFTKSGYTFAGWSDGANTYAAGATYTMPAGNVTFTAQWTAVTYTVSFDANGGSGTMADVTGVSGSYALPACTFTAPSGKQFKAWQVGTDPTERAVGYSIIVTDNVTVKAIWEDAPVVKADQTITAADVSATYGDTGKKITVTSTNYGALSYTVKSGTSATVDASGNLTIVSAGNTVITITAAGDATHNSATKDVTVSIAKATVTVKAKNQSIYVNDTVPDLSSPVKDTHYTVTGLVGSDTLTGTIALAYEKGGSSATPDNTTTGTYDIVVSGVDVPNTTNYNAIVLTKGTLTISTKPSGGGGTPTVTVPISGDAGSVNVKVTVSGATASVDNITATDLNKVVNAATEPVNVVIDMTGLGKTIDAATLTNSTLKAIADAANEDGSGITGLEVKLSGGTVVLEDKSLGVIQEKAGSDSVTIAVEPTRASDLNAKQKPVVEKLKAPAVFDIYFLAGSKRVESLNGSRIKITVPYVLTKGTAVVNYVDDAGKLEKLACTYDAAAKTVSFETTHNSYYVISADNDPCVNFTDVDRDLWYHEAIDYAIENSLMNGEGGGKFNPSGNLSRAMLCQIFYNKEGRPAVTGANPFTDVPAGQWYTDAVIWAYENKIVEGYDNGKFGPNDDITREQLAAIIWRYDGKKASAASLDAFSDAGEISSYALDALKWAYENKIVSGKGGGILDPRGKATRAEVAQMLMNYLKK